MGSEQRLFVYPFNIPIPAPFFPLLQVPHSYPLLPFPFFSDKGSPSPSTNPPWHIKSHPLPLRPARQGSPAREKGSKGRRQSPSQRQSLLQLLRDPHEDQAVNLLYMCSRPRPAPACSLVSGSVSMDGKRAIFLSVTEKYLLTG